MPGLSKSSVLDLINDFMTNETNMQTVIDMCVSKATELMQANLSFDDNNQEKFAVLTKAKNALNQQVEDLQQQITVNKLHMDLIRRRLDDTEKYTRRPNLIIDGVRVKRGETPTSLRKLILAEIDWLGIDISDHDIDRVHRHESPSYDQQGNKVQPLIIRFTTWYARNELYRSRSYSQYRYRADLTSRRQQILDFAQKERALAPTSSVVDFISVDRNCRLIFRSKDGKIHSFSSESEFKNIVASLNPPDYTSAYEDLQATKIKDARRTSTSSSVSSIGLYPSASPASPSPVKPPTFANVSAAQWLSKRACIKGINIDKWTADPSHVFIGRGYNSIWGNPFSLRDYSRDDCLMRYQKYITNNQPLLERLDELRNKTLGCFCKLKDRCHGDILINLLL